MFKNRKLMLMVIFTLTSLVFVACSLGADNGNDDTNGNDPELRTLSVGFEGDVASLDPHLSNTLSSVQVLVQIYETLVNLDVNGDVQLLLATAYERIDDYTYEFTLRQGVYFHNGAPFTADDVAFSIARGAVSPPVSAIMNIFDPDGIEVVDRYTVRIATLEPNAALVNTLTHPAAAILSVEAYETYGDFDAHPIGTGPFMLTERVHGNRLVFATFENYHGERPAFDQLIIRPIVEPAARLIALETGDIDIANLTRSDIAAVNAHPDLILHDRDILQVLYLGINTERVTDLRVRQAINYAINTEEIHATLLYGVGVPLNGPISPSMAGARNDLYHFPFNPERARELLAEAGYATEIGQENTLRLTITVNEFPDRAQWAQAAAANLANVGIELTVNPHENALFLQETGEGNYDMFVLVWTAGTGEIGYALHPLFHSSNRGNAGNRTFLHNERLDYLLDLGRRAFDDDVRLAAYAEAQEIIMSEAAMVFLATGAVMVGTRDNIGGLELMPIGLQLFHTVYFTD